jgi:site-specific recombinase XerD
MQVLKAHRFILTWPMSFKEYRQKRGYSEKSIRVQDSHVNSFKTWCIKDNINAGDITYSQALQFIDSERERGIEIQSIIREINSIRIYFDYLLESGITAQNIIKRIRLRQSGKNVLPEILSPAQLIRSIRIFVIFLSGPMEQQLQAYYTTETPLFLAF